VKSLWAYAYEIVPPQPSRRLGPIRTLLKDATAAARGGARTWSGRLVQERGATHILIVGDAPGRTHSIDRWLEAELERLDAAFSVTEPLAVVTEPLAVAGHAEGSSRWPPTPGIPQASSARMYSMRLSGRGPPTP
jgi:hypothetical protein